MGESTDAKVIKMSHTISNQEAWEKMAGSSLAISSTFAAAIGVANVTRNSTIAVRATETLKCGVTETYTEEITFSADPGKGLAVFDLQLLMKRNGERIVMTTNHMQSTEGDEPGLPTADVLRRFLEIEEPYSGGK